MYICYYIVIVTCIVDLLYRNKLINQSIKIISFCQDKNMIVLSTTNPATLDTCQMVGKPSQTIPKSLFTAHACL